MDKKLPKIFANKINEKAGNNETIYYSDKADVKIKLKNETIKKRIVGHNTTHLITIDNELIPITDIIDIEKTN